MEVITVKMVLPAYTPHISDSSTGRHRFSWIMRLPDNGPSIPFDHVAAITQTSEFWESPEAVRQRKYENLRRWLANQAPILEGSECTEEKAVIHRTMSSLSLSEHSIFSENGEIDGEGMTEEKQKWLLDTAQEHQRDLRKANSENDLAFQAQRQVSLQPRRSQRTDGVHVARRIRICRPQVRPVVVDCGPKAKCRAPHAMRYFGRPDANWI